MNFQNLSESFCPTLSLAASAIRFSCAFSGSSLNILIRNCSSLLSVQDSKMMLAMQKTKRLNLENSLFDLA